MMMWRIGRNEPEAGFTLAELMVVMTIMGMVMAAVYGGLSLTNRSNEIQRRNSFVATSIAGPMQVMDVVLSQNTVIDPGSGDYVVSCLTDQNNDNVRERHVFRADADGTFSEAVYVVASDGSNVSLQRSTVWQDATTEPPTRNVNVANAKPVFAYYHRDAAGALQVATPEDATEVTIFLEATYDGEAYSDSRRVLFRNR